MIGFLKSLQSDISTRIDPSLQCSSRVLFTIVISILIFVPPFSLLLYYINGQSWLMLLVSFTLWILLIISLCFLRNGRYYASAHIALISMLSMLWIVLILKSTGIVNTIIEPVIFIPSVLIATPLLVSAKKRHAIVYYAVNLALFLTFIICKPEILGFFLLDFATISNLIVISFMVILVYQLFRIHSKTNLELVDSKRVIDERNSELTLMNSQLERYNSELIIFHGELERANSRYVTLVNSTDSIILTTNNKGVCTFVNSAVEKSTGYRPYEIIGRHMADFLSPNDAEKIISQITELLTTGRKNSRFEFDFFNRDGSISSYIMFLSLMKDENNDFIEAHTICTDITQIKKAEKTIVKQNEQLRISNQKFETLYAELIKSQIDILESEKKYKDLYENALVGMSTIRFSSSEILKVNSTAAEMLGYSNPSDIIGNITVEELFFDKAEFDVISAETENVNQYYRSDVRLKRKDGSDIWIELSTRIDHVLDIAEIAIIDITKRKLAEDNVIKLTFYDHLTGLPNRKMFTDALKNEISRKLRKADSKVFAVACIGVDRFKHINEIHGTATGDRLLKEVSSRLKETFRNDDVISRLDSDKFIVLFSDIAAEFDIVSIVKKTEASFTPPFLVDDLRLNISVSQGVCIFPHDGDTAEELINNCEIAMYMAKDKGLSAYHLFDAGMNRKFIERIKLENEMKTAISGNQFEVYYQPIVDSYGDIAGMEALLRWNSPVHGFISPAEFIGLAEKNGMIIDIGKLVLLEACSCNKRWQQMGCKPMKVSVNISPFQLKHDGLVSIVESTLEQSGLSAEWLELEITESGIIENEAAAIAKLGHLRELGISISIDDFGTGYSSLSKLKDYPINTLKIDKAFIDEVPENLKSATLAITIIDLAHNLGFSVVAEGIEKIEQYSFLKEQCCDRLQGYYFSRPVPAEEFEKLLFSQLMI